MTDEEANALYEAGVRELTAAFEIFDRDGDGRLDAAELAHALKMMGQPITALELHKMIRAVDHDRDGKIDLVEFISLVEPRPEGMDPDADIRVAFAVLDLDGDGFLSPQELRHGLHKVDDIDAEEVSFIVRAADRDGDGKVSFAEFRELMLAEA